MLIRKYNLFVVFCFVLLALLFLNVAAFARGGGGSSHKGGHSAGSTKSHSAPPAHTSVVSRQPSRQRTVISNFGKRENRKTNVTIRHNTSSSRHNVSSSKHWYNERNSGRYVDDNRYHSYNRNSYDKYNHRYYDRETYYRRYGCYQPAYYIRYSGSSNVYVEDSGYSYSNTTSVPISTEYRYVHYPRRYIFVSLNGYWPGYSCYRYYDYGTYPYFWYVSGATSQTTTVSTSYSGAGQNFASVAQPAAQTAADLYFEEGTRLFAAGNYSRASEFFFQAKSLEPADVILPFAYIQSLFAEGKYVEAAGNLRQTIEQQPVGREWAFYPRGLYTDEQILMRQIDNLLVQAGTNSDLQLLAGYQLLGIHQFDAAFNYFDAVMKSGTYNQAAAGKLMLVLNNLKANYSK